MIWVMNCLETDCQWKIYFINPKEVPRDWENCRFSMSVAELDLLAIASHLEINQDIKPIKSKQADPVSYAYGKTDGDKSDSLQILGTFNY